MLKPLVLFPASSCGDTGDIICQLLKDTLFSTMGLDYDVILEHFTLGTEYTAVMPIVVEDYTSMTRAGWNDLRISFIAQLLNTIVKSVMNEVEVCGDSH